MSEKYQYLVDRYSQTLTKYEVQELFERLREEKGSVTAATEEADITRKTVYDWENTSNDVRAATKRKILEASLEVDPEGTMNFLVRKNAMNYHEILERYINTTFNEITRISEPQKFQKAVSSFEKYIKPHCGAIFDIKTIPIEGMIDLINQKAKSLGVEGIVKNIDCMSPQKLSLKFINLLEIFDMKTMFTNEIADKLGLPDEFVKRASKAASYIDPSRQVSEDVLAHTKQQEPTIIEGGFDLHQTPSISPSPIGARSYKNPPYIYARKE